MANICLENADLQVMKKFWLKFLSESEATEWIDYMTITQRELSYNSKKKFL